MQSVQAPEIAYTNHCIAEGDENVDGRIGLMGHKLESPQFLISLVPCASNGTCDLTHIGI